MGLQLAMFLIVKQVVTEICKQAVLWLKTSYLTQVLLVTLFDINFGTDTVGDDSHLPPTLVNAFLFRQITKQAPGVGLADIA